jgi:uncharacterized protein YndB with AHSA1/START domain
MTAAIVPAPIRKTITVKAPPRRAFEVFTQGMGRWWPATHSTNASPMKAAIVEPRAGGRWYERGEDGSECDWGKVLVWEPPHRLVLAWQIDGQWAFDAGLVTEVELRFIAEGSGSTRVELEHRHLERYAAHADKTRAALDSPGGWSGLLERFAAIAEEETNHG